VQVVGLPIDVKVERLIRITVVHFVDAEGILAELVFLWLSWRGLLLGCMLQDVVACDEILNDRGVDVVLATAVRLQVY